MMYSFDLTDSVIGFACWSYWKWAKKIYRDLRV